MKTVILAVALIHVLAVSLHAGPLDSWISRNSGTGNNLYGVTFANGTFVVVGASGTILTSADGINWTSRNPGNTNVGAGIIFNGTTWVALGQAGTIVTSTNLLSWSQQNSGTTNMLREAFYTNGIFVVAGQNGTILTSMDATNWVSQSSGTTVDVQGVAYANGIFVVVGKSGVILNSTNATNWKNLGSVISGDLTGITYGNGLFVASGNNSPASGGSILTSPDGVNWTIQNSQELQELSGVNFGNGFFVAVGSAGGPNQEIDFSADGTNWTPRISGLGPSLYRSAYGAGTFVTVGNSGTILQSGNISVSQQLNITSLQRNGLLTWTNLPGTNAFVVQWTPTLAGFWSNAAPPLDLTVSTSAQTTVPVPLVPPMGFYRVAEGFGLQSLHGAWILPATGVTNTGQAYFMADGNGTITNLGLFNLATPPGHYDVGNSGGVTVSTDTLTHGTQSLTGQFMPLRQIVFTGLSTNLAAVALPVGDLALCAGAWTGTLSETNDPNGLSDYPVSLSVDTDGSVSLSGGFSGTGWMFALAPTNGALSAFIKTGLNSSDPYNQIQLNGALSGNTITGSFDTDSGSGANAVVGTFSLTR